MNITLLFCELTNKNYIHLRVKHKEMLNRLITLDYSIQNETFIIYYIFSFVRHKSIII